MRDASRIKLVCYELAELWEKFPDMRLGQLMENFRAWLQVNKEINDMFYLEEEDFLRLFREFVDDIKG